jgi:hypothetical protein
LGIDTLSDRPSRRLRLGDERHGKERNGASEKRPPVHYSSTRSSRASTDGGIVRPRPLGGLEVDNQLELHRPLDGEIRRFGALEDLVHICGVRRSRSEGLAP